MTLPEILKAVRQWWWVLVLCPVIAASTAYFVSSRMTPIYEAQATVIVEHQLAGGALDLQSIQAAERRTRTFSQLISTRSVISPVIEELDLSISVDQFRSNLSFSHVRETQLINISYVHEDPEHAAEVVNAVSERFSDFVREVQLPVLGIGDIEVDDAIAQLEEQISLVESNLADYGERDEPLSDDVEARVANLEETLATLQQSREAFASVGQALGNTNANLGSQVSVVEPASPSGGPVSPRTAMNVGLAGMLGILLGGGLIIGLAWIEDNVKTEQDLRELVDRPVLGSLPSDGQMDRAEGVHAGRSISAELFRGLRTSLQFTMIDREVRSIVVTSVGPGEGKTTIAANLAAVLAQGGQRVILVDADMRRPRIHNQFHRVRNDRGLSNLLLQSPAIIEDSIQSTAVKNLKVLTTGPIPPNPPDLLGSGRMKALINALEDNADIVVFDSPPVAISESLLLASLTDGIIFVVRSGKNRTSEIVQGIEAASQTGVPILGTVLNGVPKDTQAAYRVYQQYYPVVDGEEELPRPPSRFGRLGRRFTRST